MADLREHFNVFEIMGPKSSQVIKGALRPVDDQRGEFRKVCLHRPSQPAAGFADFLPVLEIFG